MDLSRMIDEYVVWHEVSGHSKHTIALYKWSLGSFRPTVLTYLRQLTSNKLVSRARRNLYGYPHPNSIRTSPF
jgi:hypothetical protein